jgi:hypothetical protein
VFRLLTTSDKQRREGPRLRAFSIIIHWRKLRSTNPLERVNRGIGRRTDVVGIFPNDRSLIRLAASVVIEQTTNGSSAAATSATTRWKQSSDKKRKTTKPERRRVSSPRPEQPTIKPTSYATSWDLTLAGERNSSGSASLPISQRGSGGS